LAITKNSRRKAAFRLQEPIFSRALRSRSDWRLEADGRDKGAQDEAQESPQPGEDASEVVADGFEDDVGGIACAAFGVASGRGDLRPSVCADDRLTAVLVIN